MCYTSALEFESVVDLVVVVVAAVVSLVFIVVAAVVVLVVFHWLKKCISTVLTITVVCNCSWCGSCVQTRAAVSFCKVWGLVIILGISPKARKVSRSSNISSSDVARGCIDTTVNLIGIVFWTLRVYLLFLFFVCLPFVFSWSCIICGSSFWVADQCHWTHSAKVTRRRFGAGSGLR